MASSRHPYTHAADFIRRIAGAGVSRADASQIRLAIAKEAGIEDAWLAAVLSMALQEETEGVIRERDCPAIDALPAVSLGALSEAIEDSPAGAKIKAETCMVIAEAVIHQIDRQRPGELTLTQAQAAALPDLVALAMAGFALLKNDSGLSESASRSIAPFMPLVEEEFRTRSATHDEKMRRRYGHEDDSPAL